MGMNAHDTFAADHPVTTTISFYMKPSDVPATERHLARYATRAELRHLARDNDQYGRVANRILRESPYPAFAIGSGEAFALGVA
jgi:hypothetical protein